MKKKRKKPTGPVPRTCTARRESNKEEEEKFPAHTLRLSCKLVSSCLYRGTSLIRNRHHVRPYSRNMPRLLWWS